jgi:hypothetical protein
MYNPNHISESLETIFLGSTTLIFDADTESGMKKFGSGTEKFGSGINIPDPQHCVEARELDLNVALYS